jgi:hypothetical protein
MARQKSFGVDLFTVVLAALVVAVSTVSTLGAESGAAISAAKQLVDEALRAELAGDSARRNALLADAVRVAPSFEPARWQSGQILAAGEWQPIDDAQQAAAADPRRAEYVQLRQSGGESLDGQLALTWRTKPTSTGGPCSRISRITRKHCAPWACGGTAAG